MFRCWREMVEWIMVLIMITGETNGNHAACSVSCWVPDAVFSMSCWLVYLAYCSEALLPPPPPPPPSWNYLNIHKTAPYRYFDTLDNPIIGGADNRTLSVLFRQTFLNVIFLIVNKILSNHWILKNHAQPPLHHLLIFFKHIRFYL
jgi:hypothetical protein